MIRSLVAGLGLISVLAALIFAAFLMVNSLEDSFWGGSAGDAPSGGAADSLVLRISGTPGVDFSGKWPGGPISGDERSEQHRKLNLFVISS